MPSPFSPAALSHPFRKSLLPVATALLLLLGGCKTAKSSQQEDIAKAAATRRIVLMLDTFEQMTTLDDWVCQLVRSLHPNTLVVIATSIFFGFYLWGLDIVFSRALSLAFKRQF